MNNPNSVDYLVPGRSLLASPEFQYSMSGRRRNRSTTGIYCTDSAECSVRQLREARRQISDQ